MTDDVLEDQQLVLGQLRALRDRAAAAVRADADRERAAVLAALPQPGPDAQCDEDAPPRCSLQDPHASTNLG